MSWKRWGKNPKHKSLLDAIEFVECWELGITSVLLKSMQVFPETEFQQGGKILKSLLALWGGGVLLFHFRDFFFFF